MAKKKTLRELLSPLWTRKMIDTGKPLKNNVKITDADKATPEELSNMVDTSQLSINTLPVTNKNTLSNSDAVTLMSEETARRKIDAERRGDIKQAKLDEMERRELHKKKIQLMKDDFQSFLKNKYPHIVGQRYIRDGDENAVRESIELRKREYEQTETRLKDALATRLENEKRRKLQEANFKVNKVTTQQTFFEDIFKREYEEKRKFNPEIDNKTPIELRKEQIKEFEQILGRPVISHRDMELTPDGIVLINIKGNPILKPLNP